MHHSISYHMAKARIADLRHDARRDTRARTSSGPGRRRRPGLRPWAPRRPRAVSGAAHGGR
jgi:hypothetical protein